MPVPLEEFVKQLEDSGILAGDTIKDWIPPDNSSKHATELAQELVRQKKLTEFQVEEISKGNGKSLTLGNYVLMEKIGAGGMGQVFKARHRVMERLVAVKVLPPAMTKDQAAIARFHREVKAVSKISHPNIVTAYDADQANGVHFLVMELGEGRDLSALVKKHGPYSIEKALNYILQAAKGLEAAHAEGIVHRDIKPSNLLLDKKGTVKILDMGLARIETYEGDPVTQTELTGSGAVMGTVDYMAPEQAFNAKDADARADIYSLGCTLYYLISGQAAYSGGTAIETILAHREKPIPSLRAARPEVPERLETVFHKMIAKTVRDRYQTIAELIAALEGCVPRQEQSINIRQSPGLRTATDQTNFLKELPSAPLKDSGKGRKRLLLIAGGLLGVLILLAGLVAKLTTKDGTLVVTVNEPDAEVQVLNEEGKVEITRKGEKKPITITVDPGKHRLKVGKDGFEFFTQDFSIESGGKQPIMAKLVPLIEKPAVVGTKPVPIVGVKKPLAFESPGFDQWVKQVAAQPAEDQVKEVAKKLQELNSGFDGRVTGHLGKGTPLIENGVVTQFGFDNVNGTRNVTDISPLRTLGGLNLLWCGLEAGQLADLSPLTGMPLVNLVCPYTRISDLSPLTRMKLEVLDCANTQVSDLSPLKGMPLNYLCVANTPVSDISILQGMMSLKRLIIINTQVTDLRPLQGMRLDRFSCEGASVSDLSLLKNMPLKHVSCDFKPERDTALLRSFKDLETINCKPAAEFWKEVEEKKKEKKQ